MQYDKSVAFYSGRLIACSYSQTLKSTFSKIMVQKIMIQKDNDMVLWSHHSIDFVRSSTQNHFDMCHTLSQSRHQHTCTMDTCSQDLLFVLFDFPPYLLLLITFCPFCIILHPIIFVRIVLMRMMRGLRTRSSL